MNQLSTAKALSAARDIVDSVCRLSSSAFDPIFLPPTIIVSTNDRRTIQRVVS